MLDIKIVEIGYFLSRRGTNEPPKELEVNSWKEAYQCFYEKVNPSNKTLQEFENSLKNVRDHFDSYMKNERRGWHDDNGQPDKLPEQYQFVLGYLSQLSDEKLWEYIKPYAASNNELHWQFDISTFKLLGRELITDRITALVELVKNSYDANAKNVYINFLNMENNKEGTINKIIIKDDGFGMTEYDIKNKWMKIGTDSKRKNTLSPEPFNRRVVGEKGIGRFAIDKLGAYCKIYTKASSEKILNLLIINWNNYIDNIETNSFIKVNNKLKKRKFDKKLSGVKIEITNLHDEWSRYDLDRAYKELSKIVSPFNQLYPPFNIYINSNVHINYNGSVLVKNDAFKYATNSFSLKYNLEKGTQEIIKCIDNELTVVEEPIYNFGPLNFQLYYFNQGAKGSFKKTYQGAELQIDGIKIYRDGILTTPFAESEAHQDKQRDILGIDKRRYSGFFDKVNSRDIIGIVEITRDLSLHIIDATNRQDFIDNVFYRSLKDFIIEQLKELEKYLKSQRTIELEIVDDGLKEAIETLNDFTGELKGLKTVINTQDTDHEKYDLEKKIQELEKKALDTNIAIKKGIKQQEAERKEAERKETMYMS
ncbi:MAG: ATP-binding protein, partial [Sulfurospirillaceae bacterium]|nr:ATP-binding protein [Sulfurospirillaceae bacterium]